MSHPLRLAVLAAAFLLAGCGPSGSTPAPVTAAEAPKGAAPSAGSVPRRAILVEADGPGVELEVFLSRLQSDLSDAGTLPLVDARLSGATLGGLAADPGGSAARAFRESWPGTLLVSVVLSPCDRSVRTTSIPSSTPEGVTTYRQVVMATVSCAALLRAADPLTGKSLLNENVQGSAALSTDEVSEETPELEATRKAASKAAKRLTSLRH